MDGTLIGGAIADTSHAAAASGGCLSEPVRRALAHVVRHVAAPVTLEELGRVSERSPTQIIRAFRREMGVTPHALLIRLRIEHGAALLARGEAIAAVAAALGFVDQAHFTRHFKRLRGETPGSFVRTLRARTVVPAT